MRLPALPKKSDEDEKSRLERMREFLANKIKWKKTYVKVPKRK